MENSQPSVICFLTQKTQIGALWQPRWGGRWKGGSRRRGHMCTYDWSMLKYSRNQHNIVIILQLKIKKKNWVPQSCWLHFQVSVLGSTDIEHFMIAESSTLQCSGRAETWDFLKGTWRSISCLGLSVSGCPWLLLTWLLSPATAWHRLPQTMWFSQSLSSQKYFSAAIKRIWGGLQEGCSKQNLG